MAYTKKLGEAAQTVPTPAWRDWKSSTDFPTYVGDEQTVRSDYQYHPDKLKDQVYTLIDELDASAAGTTATKTEVDQLHEAGAVKADFERLHDNHAADVPGFAYTTTAPTEANTDGLKVCVLASEPATKYDGWLYFIKQ